MVVSHSESCSASLLMGFRSSFFFSMSSTMCLERSSTVFMSPSSVNTGLGSFSLFSTPVNHMLNLLYKSSSSFHLAMADFSSVVVDFRSLFRRSQLSLRAVMASRKLSC
uniref:Uncharacterized protein n=1 Tax=Cacopsylla melanoneura TaxID=428564 RepID=A0A8D8TX19_9HEMI